MSWSASSSVSVKVTCAVVMDVPPGMDPRPNCKRLRIHLTRVRMPGVTETTTRRLMQRDERQAQILTAAAAAFARTGFAATSMDDVAAEAGITRLIVYRHFDSKEDLYRAVLDEVRDRLRSEFQVAVEHPDPATFPFRPLIDVARANPDAL